MNRICRVCKVEKPLDDFVRHERKGQPGYEKMCLVCNRQRRADERAGIATTGKPPILDPMSDAWDTSAINLERVSRKNLKAEFDADRPLNQTMRRLRVLTLIGLRPASYLARVASEVYGV